VAYKHEDVMRAQHELLTAQKAQQLARYEAARLVEDDAETMDAADQILQADHKLAALGRIANNYVAGQQQQAGQQRSRFGLTPAEQEIARLGPDKHKDYREANGAPQYLSDDQKEEIYVRQRDKLGHEGERHLFGSERLTMVEFTRPGAKIVITETDEHGRSRQAVATNRSGQRHHWDLEIIHPNGQKWTGALTHGNKREAIIGLENMLANTENQFVRDADRGDRAPQNRQTGPRDRYVSLPDEPVYKTGR
jgi:hypothetical protein